MQLDFICCLKLVLVDVYCILNSSRVQDIMIRCFDVNIFVVAGGVLWHVVEQGSIRSVDLVQWVWMWLFALSRHLKNLEVEGCIECVLLFGDGCGVFVWVICCGCVVIVWL